MNTVQKKDNSTNILLILCMVAILLAVIFYVGFLVFIGASLKSEQESILYTEDFVSDTYEVRVDYFEDRIYIDFDTDKNGYYSDFRVDFFDEDGNLVKSATDSCTKYYYCNVSVQPMDFVVGTYKGFVELDTGATAEFQITISDEK